MVWFVCDVVDSKPSVGAPTHVRKSVSVDTSTSDVSIPNISGSPSCYAIPIFELKFILLVKLLLGFKNACFGTG